MSWTPVNPNPVPDEEQGQYAWVAHPTVLVCPICATSEHVEAFHGCMDYQSVMLMVIELWCQEHKIRVATFPVCDAVDPY